MKLLYRKIFIISSFFLSLQKYVKIYLDFTIRIIKCLDLRSARSGMINALDFSLHSEAVHAELMLNLL